jgi:transmembrane sensor
LMAYETHSVDLQAAQWIDRMRRPVLDSDTAADFDRWILKDPRHVESYARIQGLWDSDGLEAALQRARLPHPDNDDRAAEEAGGRAGRGWWRMARAGAATSLFLLACAAGAQLLVEEALYTTARGQMRTVALADGSTIRMDGDTRIAVRFAPWSRHVVLEKGEAFFDVAHERLRGFAVDAGGANISVLGTAFDVDRVDRDTSVVQVYRGLVSIDAGSGRQWRLPAGGGLELSGERVRSLRVSGGSGPSWTQGWFEASDTTIRQLVARLNRTIDRPITLADPALGELRVTGRFQTRDPEGVLEVVTAIHDLRWHDAGNHYVLER